MKSVSNVIMKLIGIILITAAILKGYQLLTEPTAEATIWSQRWFLILQVEFEFFLGIWLMSGIMKRAAWLAALSCFVLFSGVTLYKGISGAESCGCFGSVKINPWVTLLVIDLPAVLGLGIFRPAGLAGQRAAQCKKRLPSLVELFTPLPPLPRVAACLASCLVMLTVTTSILALNEPQKITSTYEVLEPETWVGKELPILDYIDIGGQLREGNWVVLFYHHDCPDCRKAMICLEQKAKELKGNGNFLRVAFVEIPPYGRVSVYNNSNYIYGHLKDVKEWFVTTPVVVLVTSSDVQKLWNSNLPIDNTFFEHI